MTRGSGITRVRVRVMTRGGVKVKLMIRVRVRVMTRGRVRARVKLMISVMSGGGIYVMSEPESSS